MKRRRLPPDESIAAFAPVDSDLDDLDAKGHTAMPKSNPRTLKDLNLQMLRRGALPNGICGNAAADALEQHADLWVAVVATNSDFARQPNLLLTAISMDFLPVDRMYIQVTPEKEWHLAALVAQWHPHRTRWRCYQSCNILEIEWIEPEFTNDVACGPELHPHELN